MWDWAIWGALILAGLAGIAALALVFARARQAWRDVRDTRRDVVRRLDDLVREGEETAEKVATPGETAELQQSLARLRVSRARLLPVPIARVRNALSDYRRTAESLGAERTLLVATSAVRDAENGEAFLGEIEWSYGFVTQLLSGDDEAALTRRGIGELGAATLLVDIGGGSTELVLDEFHTSLPMGSVRFTERHGDDAT